MKRACAILFLLVLVVVASSCNKTPEPTPKPEPTPTDTIPPVTPNDTITPVTPNDTIVPTPGIDTIPPAPGGDTIVPPTPGGDTIPPVVGGTKKYIVEINYNGFILPTLDSVREWVSLYDTVRLFVRATCSAWTPGSFHVVRDSLSPRFDISPKVRGGWGFQTYQILDDDQVNNIGVLGMIRSDSTQFANWGYGIYPQVTGKKPQQPPRYNGNRIQRAGRSH